MVKRVGSVLSNFKLYFEDLEKKVEVTSKVSSVKRKAMPKTSLKVGISNNISSIKGHFNNVLKKLKHPRKKAKKLTKTERKFLRQQNLRAILGIGLLLVIVSIAYSTTVIFIGVDSSASRLALLPQVVFALYTLIKAFSKFYK